MGLRDWWNAQKAGFRYEQDMRGLDNAVTGHMEGINRRLAEAVNAPAVSQNATRLAVLRTKEQLADLERRTGDLAVNNARLKVAATRAQLNPDRTAKGIGAWFGRLFSGRLTKASRDQAAQREEQLGRLLHMDPVDAMDKEMLENNQDRLDRAKRSHEIRRDQVLIRRAREANQLLQPQASTAAFRQELARQGRSPEEADTLAQVRDYRCLYRPGEKEHNEKLNRYISMREAANQGPNLNASLSSPEAVSLCVEISKPFVDDFMAIGETLPPFNSNEYRTQFFSKVTTVLAGVHAASDFLGNAGRFHNADPQNGVPANLPTGYGSLAELPPGYTSRGWEQLFPDPKEFASYMESKNELAVEHNKITKEIRQVVNEVTDRFGEEILGPEVLEQELRDSAEALRQVGGAKTDDAMQELETEMAELDQTMDSILGQEEYDPELEAEFQKLLEEEGIQPQAELDEDAALEAEYQKLLEEPESMDLDQLAGDAGISSLHGTTAAPQHQHQKGGNERKF